jgi:murein DD-endopeptidase MepM/ murein hydrolase activator NlpD
MKYLSLLIVLILFTCIPVSESGYAASLSGAGCPGADYPDWKTSNYVLPYPVGKTYKVDLSNCSSSYHAAGYPDQFAYDFNMAIGTLITASREGTVVAIVESGTDYTGTNNYVAVDHGDNTYAIYMHLTKDGAAVQVGDKVEKGDTIGYSGATGLAGYPHLHLVVTKNSYTWPYVSIPFNFRNTNPNERGLKSYTRYKANSYLPFLSK